MNPGPISYLDGNEAAASVAHRCAEVIAIYPITPSSAMGELSDEWSAAGRKNLWGSVPQVVEMQSEAGAAGAVHGALQAGALATTFTSSQGLLLMVPDMYRIAGQLLPFTMHVAARTVATHALSIFGDHSDVMACRQTGFALLSAATVQEAHDLAAVAHAATLRTRVPFLHFFDGFRTSHELARVELLPDQVLRDLLDPALLAAHRARALSPDHPVLRGTAQNPDVFFQAREAANPFYLACPRTVQQVMDELGERTGRRYRLFEYHGHPDAERVVLVMGSAGEAVRAAVDRLCGRGEKVGMVQVRLYRPFSVDGLLEVLPRTADVVGVLDRCKEPGAPGEPLYLDVVAALNEARRAGPVRSTHDPLVVGGRYGLSSKELTPAMACAVFAELAQPRPRNHFTVGIRDDVTRTSLVVDPDLDVEHADTVRAVFYGLGADGTVGASKNTVKILGSDAGLHAQGYFVYDSRKSGTMTTSHLRFGPRPIRAPWLIRKASFVGVHHPAFLDRFEVLDRAAPGATVLVNTRVPAAELWDSLPADLQQAAVDKHVRLWAIDANRVALDAGLGGRINTVMQTCFFALSGVLPRAEAIARIKAAVRKSYARKGAAVVDRNEAAVDRALAGLHEVPLPGRVTAHRERPTAVPAEAPDFVRRVTARMLEDHGDELPVSAFPPDGTWPVGTTRYEKRNIATETPAWQPALCIQCNKCAIVCPHAAIRTKVFAPEALATAPDGFVAMDYKGPDYKGDKYVVAVGAEDCTGCRLCVEVCPGHDKADPSRAALAMQPHGKASEAEKAGWAFFLGLPEADRSRVKLDVKGSQWLQPLFEYSGACSGCGETPYVKLLTQLFGDRALVANATGCSSIFGGNLPTTPYCTDAEGRGPAWANSLFEDNAEFGLGMRLALDGLQGRARDLLGTLQDLVPAALVTELLAADMGDEAGIAAQRARVQTLRGLLQGTALQGTSLQGAAELAALADHLVRKSVWIVGGDGWAYDIGYGGLDHVLSLGRDVNILVLDTEVYSNTGGQQSKATPIGATARFAAAGKATGKKDLALLAMAQGNAYVARVALGAKDAQTVRALLEAESYPGPSIVLAYAHCVAHGIDMAHGLDQQKAAVASGHWPLFRYDPRRAAAGENPLKLDSGPAKMAIADFALAETRFRSAQERDPARFDKLMVQAQADAARRLQLYQQVALAAMPAREPTREPTPDPVRE